MSNQTDNLSLLSVGPVKAWLYRAAGLSAVAGLLHLVVTPEHFTEWFGYGLFFLMVAVLQLLYAALLLARKANRGLLLAGVVGHVVIISLTWPLAPLAFPSSGRRQARWSQLVCWTPFRKLQNWS
ncbi:MAG: hypothetical protein AB1791_11835 [Chloroflexota bacterium]